MRTKKPSVTLRCPANFYSAPNERIIEFSDSRGNGGLISFRETDAGLVVDLYRCTGVDSRGAAARYQDAQDRRAATEGGAP